MPVINLDIEDLSRLVGEDFSLDQFVNEIPMIGASVEKVEGKEIAVEFFPDRPDLFSVEGIARAFRSFKGMEGSDQAGSIRIEGSSGMELKVDPSVGEVRPVIGAAFVKGVNIDENALLSIMNLQEKLHITVGRKRRKVAIGIHDAAPLAPPFQYWAAAPNEISFVPLQKDEEWDLERILKEHEKGTAYAWVLEKFDRYPMITDSKGQVLSFPPIINGELTRVTGNTKDVFIDCTGWDLKAVNLAVNIVCAQMVDRGGTIEDVKVIYPEGPAFKKMGLKTGNWPKMKWKETSLNIDWARSWLGLDISPEEMGSSLKRMGFSGPVTKGSELMCLVPPWRGDILHQADLAEDLAIGYGFQRFTGTPSRYPTTGAERRLTSISRYIRQTFTGLGFLEVRTLSLSNEEAQFEMMGREEFDHIRLVNPITTEHTMIRSSVIPTLLSLLKANKHRDLPQRLFENADVMVGNGTRNVLCALSEDNKASFTEVKGYVQKVLQDLGIAFILEPSDLGQYIKGRSAAVMIDAGTGDTGKYNGPFPELAGGGMVPLGHFGEIHPRLISANELSAPVSALELDLDMLTESADL